jgi:hypothetical protein
VACLEALCQFADLHDTGVVVILFLDSKKL